MSGGDLTLVSLDVSLDPAAETAAPVAPAVGVHSGSADNDPGKKSRRRQANGGLGEDASPASEQTQHQVDSLA